MFGKDNFTYESAANSADGYVKGRLVIELAAIQRLRFVDTTATRLAGPGAGLVTAEAYDNTGRAAGRRAAIGTGPWCSRHRPSS